VRHLQNLTFVQSIHNLDSKNLINFRHKKGREFAKKAVGKLDVELGTL